MSKLDAHINTTEVSLFDTGVGQEGIDESHVHSNTLKNLFILGNVYCSQQQQVCDSDSPQSLG